MVGAVEDWEQMRARRHRELSDRAALLAGTGYERFKGMSGGMEEAMREQKESWHDHAPPMVKRSIKAQHGGNHYQKMKIQPIEYIIANQLDYLSGNIIKYASRHQSKGGADDIRKIKQYCDFILESQYGVGA